LISRKASWPAETRPAGNGSGAPECIERHNNAGDTRLR
jgi:hypothetical protein